MNTIKAISGSTAFLLACCNHFLANEHDRQRAKKRGGGRRVLSLDAADAEGRYLTEPADDLTPERLFERLPDPSQVGAYG